MKISELYAWGREQLIRAGFDPLDAADDNRFLFSGIFHLDPMVPAHQRDDANPEKRAAYEAAIEQRRLRRPVAYILGEWEFMGLPFETVPGVLIPRPDTEILTEAAIGYAKLQIPSEGHYRILDLCTGSGCIAISLYRFLSYRGEAEITATDLSEDALAVARRNAALNRARIDFRKGDLWEAAEGTYDLIVSNPPYIPEEVIDTLQADVKYYEPRMALSGGRDGLMFYQRIVDEAASYLCSQGMLMLEIGEDQAEAVQELFQADSASWECNVIKDYGGRDRVITARLTDKGKSNV